MMEKQDFVYKGGKQKVPKGIVRARIDPSVKSIGPIAFKDRPNLKYVEFSEGLEKISCFAFSCCKSLQFVSLPASARIIGLGAFENCVSMKYARLNYGLEQILQSAFSGCTLIEYVCIPSTVCHLGSYAFVDCTSLREVALNQGLRKLHHGTFQWCEALEVIGIPSTVSGIAESAIPETALQDKANSGDIWRRVYLQVQELADSIKEEATNSSNQEHSSRKIKAGLTAQLKDASAEIQQPKEDRSKSIDTTGALHSTTKESNLLQKEVNELRAQLDDLTSKFECMVGVVAKMQLQLDADVAKQGKETQGELQRGEEKGSNEVIRNIAKPRNRSDNAAQMAMVAPDGVRMLTEQMELVMNIVQTQGNQTRSELQQVAKDLDGFRNDQLKLNFASDAVTPGTTVTVAHKSEDMSDSMVDETSLF